MIIDEHETKLSSATEVMLIITIIETKFPHEPIKFYCA